MGHLSVSLGASNGKPRSLLSVDGQQAILSDNCNAMKLVKIGEKTWQIDQNCFNLPSLPKFFTAKVFKPGTRRPYAGACLVS